MEQNQNPTQGANTPNTPAPSLDSVAGTAKAPVQAPIAGTPNPIVTAKKTETPEITHELDVNPVQQISSAAVTTNKMSIRCNIRRKPFNAGLPGTNAADRQFKIGASLNINSKKCLKGVDGELEKVIMPIILGIGANEPSFQRELEDYWNNIGVLIPSDEEAGKEEDKGKVLDIPFIVKGTALKESIDNEVNIENKVALISEGLINKTVEIADIDKYFDFVFLCYVLRNKEVANDVDKMWFSPKIKYYIFNKTITTTKKYNLIQLKDTARPLFQELRSDDIKLNAMLMMFNMLPSAYPTTMDKVIALDEVYDKTSESLSAFINFAKDENLDLKYLIKLAVKKNKITVLAGTESHYYNQILLGRTLNDTVMFLKDDMTENQNIKRALEREVKE